MFRRDGDGERHRGSGIHALYHAVLDDARKEGRSRADSETASEFAPALQSLFHNNATDDITRAFEQARYAGRPPAPQELAELERRWKESRYPESGKI